jgi:outer membrane protein assembly factor BamB/TolA-binding protein
MQFEVMASIEIQYQTGPARQQKLTKTEPLSIGRHSSNDICIDEDGVAVIHCRISWNGKAWEVFAGGDGDGVEVNGTLVQSMRLTNGDLLRVGSVDITFRRNTKSTDDVDEEDEEDEFIGLQQVTDDEVPILKRATDAAREMGGPAKSGRGADRKQKPKTHRATEKAAEIAGNEMFQSDDDDEIDARILARVLDGLSDAADIDKPPRAVKDDQVDSEEPQESEPLLQRLKRRVAGTPARPGEQDIVRSPLVLGLGGGSLVLLLAAVTVWFIIGRETAKKQYDAAQHDLGDGNYKDAIDRFKSFIQGYPRHEYTEAARYGLGRARIQLALSGATPKWAQGLEHVRTFDEQHRDRSGYADQKQRLRGFAEKIALGAVKAAERAATRPNTKVTGLRKLLDVSREAGGLLNRLHPADEQPVELQRQLADLLWKAEKAIEKKETFLAAVTAIERSIEDGRPREALSTRNDLLSSYSDFRNDRRLAQLLTEILKVEQGLVESEDVNRDAMKNERDVLRNGEVSEAPLPLSLTRHTQSGSSDESVGQTVVAVAKDCCYGIDTVTGEPLWRRVIGLDNPFFPISAQSSVQGLLLFDTNFRELTLIDRRTGNLEWRQPIEEEVAGPPLVHEGQIYLPTLSGRLYQIVLDTGKVTKRLTFSQQLLTPPVLVRDKTQIVVAGRESVLYTLSLRPLACLAVTFSDHQAGAVEAPLLTMGPFVLLIENHQIDSCRLRVFDTSDNDRTLKETATATISGRVHNQPVIRGAQLFVTSSPERITAFTVSKDEDQPPLVRITETQVSGEHSGPLFLKTGADGQLWMAGSAFRSFQLKTDTIVFDEAERVAVGISTQPLQLVDRYFFLGRRQPYHQAVLFTPVERDQLTSHWKTVLGSSLIALIATAPDAALCVTETGDVYGIGPSELKAGGFRLDATDSLPLNEAAQSPIKTAVLSKDRLALHIGAPEPRLWVVHAVGRIVRTIDLPQPLEANPVLLDAGIVLPVPGRLMLVRSAGGSPVEDYPAPLEKGKKPRWAHLVRIDGDELLAINSLGRLMRIQFRASQVAHLAEVDRLELGRPIDVSPAISAGRFVVADAGGHLKVFNLATMDLLSEVELDAPASNRPWIVNDRLYVETVDHRLICFSMEGKLQQIWTLPLENSPLAGAPLAVGNQIVVARQNGEVWALDPTSGEIQNRLNVGQPASLGSQNIGEFLVLPTIDGSLHRIESVLAEDQAGEAE